MKHQNKKNIVSANEKSTFYKFLLECWITMWNENTVTTSWPLTCAALCCGARLIEYINLVLLSSLVCYNCHLSFTITCSMHKILHKSWHPWLPTGQQTTVLAVGISLWAVSRVLNEWLGESDHRVVIYTVKSNHIYTRKIRETNGWISLTGWKWDCVFAFRQAMTDWRVCVCGNRYTSCHWCVFVCMCVALRHQQTYNR